MSRTLRFPILRRIRIEGYQLFPGQHQGTGAHEQGIDREIVPGVTVIVGINGLGKTTLLNALFRVLSGPVDWKARGVHEAAGSTPTTLGDWRTSTYFRDRVADDATRATISVEVGFGDRSLEVKRSLRDLAIQSLRVDGRARPKTEEAYQESVVTLSGAASMDDFFLVLRYLVFFLEERQPIVWDASAQSDILRVLFFDAEGARESRRLFDNVQQADSRFRNIRPHLRKLEQQFDRAREAATTDPALLAEFAGLRTRAAALEEEERSLDSRLAAADEERRDQRLRLELARHTLEEHQVAYALAEQQHVAHVFPGVDEIAEYVFVRASSGCLVCGSRNGAAQEHIRARLRAHRCPLCDSPPSQQEGVIAGGIVNERRLRALDKEVQTTTENVRALEQGLSTAVAGFERLIKRALQVRQELAEVRLGMGSREVRLPPDGDELERMGEGLKQLRTEARKWEKRRQLAEAEFRTVLARGERRVRDLHEQIATRFSYFVRSFIAEQCDIEYSAEERRIGQEGERFSFPRFTVRLTSAVTPTEPQPRRDELDVSESQREFIDLAFRMALLEVAAGDTPLMLVLETPEASLDALFVARAGQLLRAFAGLNSENRVIASSNLTKGEMISALLGAGHGRRSAANPHYVPQSERPARVIDLLHLAAPNAALREFRAEYEKALDAAIYPERQGRSLAKKGRR